MAENLQVDDQLPLDIPQAKDAVTVTPAAPASDDPTIAELKRQVKAEKDAKAAALATAESERRGRLEAEQRTVGAHERVEQYKTQAQTAEQQAINNAIEAANRETEAALQQYEFAMSAADYNASGKAQAKIAKVAAQLAQLEAAKSQIDAQVGQRQQVRVDVSPPYRQADPTEQFISAQNPKVQSWLRQHPGSVVDKNGRPDFSPDAWAGHYDALAKGIAEGSDEYFQHLTDRVMPAADVDDGVDDAPAPAPIQRRTAPVAAPVSRDTPSNSGAPRKPTRMHLTADEAEAAKFSGLSPQQYWENKQALAGEGKLGRTTH